MSKIHKSINNNSRIVITYGTFDLLHYGHIRLLERAKSFGDFLIVGLSDEKFNLAKHKESFLDYNERKSIIESIKYVDLVIPEKNWEQKTKDIKKYSVNTFVIGDDWSGKFDDLKQYCNVIYLPRTHAISTTLLKSSISMKK